MINWVKENLTEQVRGYIYRVLLGVGAVVGMYGIMDDNEVATWLGLAAIVLNIMPATNTSIKKPTE